MKAKVAIVICNYNKKDYVLGCIDSVFSQTFHDYDLYVVDNASTDGSAEAIRAKYGNRLTLIENPINTGGSGGFNTGVRRVLEGEYTYLMLVDNDIYMDKDNIANLIDYMDSHEEVGIAGSKIYKMDKPDEIQEFGVMIDFDRMGFAPCYAGENDRADIPDVIECDYVAACSLMTRTKLIKKLGMMPEDNFIYWDDIEWGWKYNLAGRQVVALANAKVWHKGGSTVSINTFQAYYMYRNKIQFFAKYYPREKSEQYSSKVLEDVFRASYACYCSGRINRAKTIIDAFVDALNRIKGKADEYKIRPADQVKNPLKTALDGIDELTLLIDEQEDSLPEIKKNIINCNPSVHITEAKTLDEQREKAFVIRTCSHIFEIEETQFQYPFIDRYGNVVLNEHDFELCRNYRGAFAFFQTCFCERLEKLFIELQKS